MKTIDIRPVTGFMDSRSSPDEVSPNGYRYVQNWHVIQKNKLCRIPGFDRLLTRANYNNQDLHDQLLSITGIDQRYPITLLFEAISTTKSTKLIAGTEQALYALNSSTGNWSVLSDMLGGPGARWRAAQLGDVVVFTNNLNPVVYWNVGAPPLGDDNQAVAEIDDLVNVKKVTRVGTVVTFRNHMFYMNVVQEGKVLSNKIIWSNINRAISLRESSESTQGSFELEYNEIILNAMSLGSSLIVYTNRGIWEGVQSSDPQQLFVFIKRYSPEKSGENCLFYPNTLVSNGNEHLFAGTNGIYVYSLFKTKPELVEWIHKSSDQLFKDIKSSDCQIHIAAYHDARKELRFSFTKSDEDVPSSQMVYNTEFPFGHVEDYGATAYVTHVAKDSTSLRQFILDNCICDSIAELDEAAGAWVKEGRFCTAQPEPDCPTGPTHLWSDQPLEIEDGLITEDYEGDSTSNSMGAFIDKTLEEICEAESKADECNLGKRFIVACASDNTLKELSENYYRELTVGFTGCGTFEKRGYVSIIRSGPLHFSNFHDDKEFHRFEVEASPALQTIPSQFSLRIGNDAQASDPNVDECGIVWHTQKTKNLECQSSRTAAEHKENNTRASRTISWPLYYINRFLFWELSVVNSQSVPFENTGGAVCVSRYSVDIHPVSIRKV